MKKNAQELIIFEDDSVVAVNKPAGLLTLPDRYRRELPNVRAILEAHYGSIFTVHRLDTDTSGILLFARDAEAHRNLSMQFEQHTPEKVYQAVVAGIVEQDEFEIDIPLAPDERKPGLTRPSARGKESLTVVNVVERYRMASYVECRPKTGRHHQIRAHLAAVGHPLLVDPDYGRLAEFMLSTIKRRYKVSKGATERPLIARTTLHAASLTVAHPVTGEPLSIIAPLPKDISAVLQVLRKYASYVPIETYDFVW